MHITSTQQVEVAPEALAEALARSGPKTFAKFWFAFAEIAKKDGVDLDALGRAMAPAQGGMRRDPLRTIVHAMEAEIYRNQRQSR
jgi:hypothetical protein